MPSFVFLGYGSSGWHVLLWMDFSWFSKGGICTPKKINMEPGNDGFQVRNLLFQGAPISRFHVCFGGCMDTNSLAVLAKRLQLFGMTNI